MTTLPSIADTDNIYASDDKEYIFDNPNDLSIETLVNHILHFLRKLLGFSEFYRNAATPNGIKLSLIKGLDTYHHIFESSAERYADDPCLAFHEYDYENSQHLERYATISYKEVRQRKDDFAAANYKLYDSDNMSFIVTFYAANRVEWVLSDLACSSNSITSTALYDTLGPDTSKYILETTESPVIISSKDHIRDLIDLKKANPKELAALILIISMDPLKKSDQNLVHLAEANNIKLYDFSQVERTGAIFPHQTNAPNSETVFTITFTSGTTGANPKGVVLPQRCAASGMLAYSVMMPHHRGTREFAFLPLAHIFERQMVASMFMFGGSSAMPRLGGTPLTLVEDLKLWKPTFMANVPRVFTKIEAGIKASTIDSTSSLTRSLYERAIEAKRVKQNKNDDSGDHFIYDKLLIQRLRSAIGYDCLEFCVTGSAPIAPETIKFLKASLGIGFGQGYGSSESFAGMLFALPFKNSSVGTCGVISPTMEARLRELPDMGYMLNDKNGPRGELQLRGSQLFTRYYKNPEETAKSIDEDGWFSTGDVAEIGTDGYFRIIDRVKNFYKLSQGEYVSPEKIESLYLSLNSSILQLFIHGDSTKSFLVGVVGLQPDVASKYVDLSSGPNVVQVLNQPEFRKQLLLDLNLKVNGKLQGFEKLHNIFIDIEPLTLERNVVTPTMKLKRHFAAKFFKPQIEAMYAEGSIVKDYKL
ncbi:Long-chain-fatty-acid--CoA ligase 2 [Candida viswanathii]|uniref:Long-chain-fatty-acid--CoA ligase 2 n=1 Tax=Candida viswanathii TaxID=5486 RepID=A0A367XRE6_9ASCO|nr:Long-chain-fatty-acid--CoA ligase 2 [Candida viswanathii]